MTIPAEGDRDLVGRDVELAMVGALVADAASGRARSLLVWGDSGVGKTSLVRVAAAASDALILSGAALPLGSLSIPFLALRSALRSHPTLDAPTLDSSDGAPSAPVAFDGWLDRLCRDHTVLLIIDDLQWADQSTLDALLYVLAGPPSRRLLVVATIRSTEVDDGHPLQRWLANIRRLPGFAEQWLGPLDRLATTDQIARILGGPPHQSLIDDVYARTCGNPYLTRLVVTGLRPDARQAAVCVPIDLRSAVLQAWQRLGPSAREATRVLAVARGPVRAAELAEILGQETVGILMREAVDAGVLDIHPGGTYWFHHPMIAEVLEKELPEDDRRHWHAAFAELLQRRMQSSTAPSVALLVAIADHEFRAGRDRAAYDCAVRASAATASAGGVSESLRLLRRALTLQSGLPDLPETRIDLLDRARVVAASAGAAVEELQSVDELLAVVSRADQPLRVSELLVRRGHLRFLTGQTFLSVADMQEAASIAEVAPESPQYAFALAELSHAMSWTMGSESSAVADKALVVARVAVDPRALSYALTASAIAALDGKDPSAALRLAAEAFDAAVTARDWMAATHATFWEANATGAWSERVVAQHLMARREQLTAIGAPHSFVGWISAVEATSWLSIGEWRECTDRLRSALGSNPGPLADAVARLAAARLAAWQGRREEAAAHLARADELFATGSQFVSFQFDAIHAEVALAAADPVAGYQAAARGMASDFPPTMCEWLVPLAARALADQVQSASDSGRDPSVPLALLADLVGNFPALIKDRIEPTPEWAAQMRGLTALYAAEVGRARRDNDNGTQWTEATHSCELGGLAWEEAYSAWRAAEALLTSSRPNRDAAASMVHRGLELAARLQAHPIQTALEQLAASARISVEAVSPRRVTGVPAVLPGLTAREAEILDHIVAGRSYGQIARALVISEKTVSSHVSNLLRKTGTTNRFDLASLASRVSAPQGR